jgi:hypothetical protein
LTCPCQGRVGNLRFDHGDRVRLIVASCLTVVALPVLLNEGKDQRAERPPTMAVVAPGAGAIATLGSQPTTAAAPAASVSEPTSAPPPPADQTTAPHDSGDDPSFLAGPFTPTSMTGITVAVPDTTSRTRQTGRASYRRWPPGSSSIASPCAAWFLDVGTAVTVTNLDNGHSVKCVIVDRRGVPSDQIIVVDTALFHQLADVVEAPIPVTINW